LALRIMTYEPVLLAGAWRAADAVGSFHAENPATAEPLPGEFPISSWSDCDTALAAATEAAAELSQAAPEQLAQFLTDLAASLEARQAELVATAHAETALPKSPRLAEVELPRTTGQLRQAAAAVREGSWAMPTIDTQLDIRSMLGPVGPVLIFGPNNFPFAYNGVGGGDFAAAIAAGNPVIAKAHPCHPQTSRRLAEIALAAVKAAGLPPATVQMLYHLAPEAGCRFVADRRLGATGFTGSRAAGLQLKAAADAAGRPIYLEMSSLNPVLILPGALTERGAKIAEELAASCLMAGGQFCTSPGFTILFGGAEAEVFVAEVKQRLENAPTAPLLSGGVARTLAASVQTWRQAGADLLTGGAPVAANRFQNTLLSVSGEKFLAAPEKLQTEAFGNASLLILVRNAAEAAEVLGQLEGNLTGSIYSATTGADDALYTQLEPRLRARVGRLLNDKMPTGVAVTPAMNHGGPFPATGHPGFTAVGIPAALRRFGMLQCYDHVRPPRLPAALRNKNPNGKMWRLIDGSWSQQDVPAAGR
jgi:NADP-dependent aldehyde dehydrogenase